MYIKIQSAVTLFNKRPLSFAIIQIQLKLEFTETLLVPEFDMVPRRLVKLILYWHHTLHCCKLSRFNRSTEYMKDVQRFSWCPII